jgi:hypothetical protein
MLAVGAAAVGAWAAYRVGNAQVVAAKQRNRLQARCLAVAIYPEPLDLEVAHKRAIGMFADELPKARRERWHTAGTVALIRAAQIEIPPLLDRTLDQLYLVGEAGPELLQLISVLLQYNTLVEKLAQQIHDNVDSFDRPAREKSLGGQLSAIGRNIAEAQRLLGDLHP